MIAVWIFEVVSDKLVQSPNQQTYYRKVCREVDHVKDLIIYL
jgi:hypothetical protein